MIYKFFVDWANFYVNGIWYLHSNQRDCVGVAISVQKWYEFTSLIHCQKPKKCDQSIVQNFDGLTRKFKHSLPTPHSSL